MTRQAEGTARTAPASGLRAAARPLLFACLVAALAVPLASGAPLQALAADVDVDVDAKVEVTVEVEVDAPKPPAVTYAAKVHVLDVSGRPVPGASVTVQGGSSSQTTGSEGDVRVSGLSKNASYAVSVSKAGYRTFTARFVCHGLAGEVWHVVLHKPAEDPGPSREPDVGGEDGSTRPPANPMPTVDVRDGASKTADDAAAPGDAAAPHSAGSSAPGAKKGDAAKPGSSASDKSDGSDEGSACPWPWLLAALLALLALVLFVILLVRRKKRDEEEDPEPDTPGPNTPQADAPGSPDAPEAPQAGSPDGSQAGSPNTPQADAPGPEAPDGSQVEAPDTPQAPEAPQADAPGSPDAPAPGPEAAGGGSRKESS